MGRNVIVSEETLRDLLEAHASLSAWYHAAPPALVDPAPVRYGGGQ